MIILYSFSLRFIDTICQLFANTLVYEFHFVSPFDLVNDYILSSITYPKAFCEVL